MPLYVSASLEEGMATHCFPDSSVVKESTCQGRRCGFDPWWQPTPVSLPGESYGRRSLEGYSPRGCKESDTTEGQSMHTCIHFITETFFFWLHCKAYRILFPKQGSDPQPDPLHLKCRVLTTGPPGKALKTFLLWQNAAYNLPF